MAILAMKIIGSFSIVVFLSMYFANATENEELEQRLPSEIIFNLPTMKELLMAAPTVRAQLGLWLFHAVLWYIICNIIAFPFVYKLINKMESKARYMNLCRQTIKKTIGIDIGEDDSAVSFIALVDTCVISHAIGGLLAVPSAFGMSYLLPSGIAYAMARHGNLVELGWETEDTFLRLYGIIFGGEFGRKKNPPGLMFALLLHHTASFCMVIPVNIYYPDYAEMHELSCLLQLAAAVALFVQHYGYTLDVKTPQGLSKMKVCVCIAFAIIIWSRVIRYFWLAWNIGWTIWLDENWLVFKLFCVPAVCLTLFNVVIVMDSALKVFKFLPMSVNKHEEENIVELATDAASAGTVARRPSSCFGLSKSEKEWAKIRGVVRMCSFKTEALRHNKED